MTREEEITMTSRRYNSKGSSVDFEAGARWADENPKNPWISVDDDLPCNHDDLLESNYSIQTHKVIVAYNNGKYYGFARMNKIIGIWEWYDRSDDITHWMPIPKMTKEE